MHAFTNKGFTSTSTRDIATLAGVNQGLITYYFRSKERLWKVAMDRYFGSFRNELAQRMQEFEGMEESSYLRVIFREFVRFASHSPYVVRLMMEAAKTPSKQLDWLLDRHIRPVYYAVAHLLTSGQRNGLIRKGPIVNLYYHFVGSSLVFALPDEVRRVAGANAQSPAFIEAHADCLIDMLMAQPRLRPALRRRPHQ
jgi:AcrR family transcriptional regulator